VISPSVFSPISLVALPPPTFALQGAVASDGAGPDRLSNASDCGALQAAAICLVAATALTALVGLYGIWRGQYQYPRAKALILEALKDGPLTGRELMQKLGISGGAIYVYLHRMEEKNLIHSEPVDPKRPTLRRYSLREDHLLVGNSRDPL
jgi:hypothetical protein